MFKVSYSVFSEDEEGLSGTLHYQTEVESINDFITDFVFRILNTNGKSIKKLNINSIDGFIFHNNKMLVELCNKATGITRYEQHVRIDEERLQELNNFFENLPKQVLEKFEQKEGLEKTIVRANAIYLESISELKAELNLLVNISEEQVYSEKIEQLELELNSLKSQLSNN